MIVSDTSNVVFAVVFFLALLSLRSVRIISDILSEYKITHFSRRISARSRTRTKNKRYSSVERPFNFQS
jgi:hypothetical protein